jgi:hypothetical protein
VTAKLQLSNPREPALAPIEVAALADTGSVFLCIPEHVRLQLKLEVLLGAIAMEEMDLVVNPRDRTVDVNPDSPNIAQGVVKRAA